MPPLLAALPDYALSAEVDIIFLRVSTHSAKELRENVDAGATSLAHLPAAAYLQTLDLETLLLDRTAKGDRLRVSLDVREIRRSDVHPYALSPQTQMGWIVPVPVPSSSTIVVLISDSASGPTVKSPYEQLPSNAVAELLVALLLLPTVRRLHLTEWARWVRDHVYGSKVRLAAQRGGVEVFEGMALQDIYTSAGQTTSAVKDSMSVGERESTARRTTRGVLGKLSRQELAWPYSRALTPPAYDCGEYSRERDDSGKTRRVATLVAESGQQLQGWQAWAEALADGRPHREAAQHLAVHRVRCRGQKYVNPDGSSLTYDQLTPLQREGASFSLSRHCTTLLDRTYEVCKAVPVPIAPGARFEGYEIDRSDSGKHGFGVIRKQLMLPEHGVVLTAEQQQRWRLRLQSRTERDRQCEELRAPFADVRLQWYRDNTGSRRTQLDEDWTVNMRVLANMDSYEVWSRSRAEAHNDRGTLRGWRNREGTHALTMRRNDFERAYARAGIDAALAHLGRLEPVRLPARPRPAPLDRQQQRAARLGDLDTEILTVSDAVEDAETVLAAATARGRGVNEATDRLQQARQALGGLQSEQARLGAEESDQDAPVPEVQATMVAQVALDTPAGLFGVLAGAAGQLLPRVVADCIVKLSSGNLDIRPHPNLPEMIEVRDVLSWPTRDDSSVPPQIHFLIPNRRRGMGQAARQVLRRESAAMLVLRDGKTPDQAAGDMILTREQVVTHVRAWLQDPARTRPVPSRGARSAITDCPIPLTKLVVYEAATGTTSPSAADDRYRRLIEDKHFSEHPHANSWVSRDVTLERQVLHVLRTLDGQGVDLAQGVLADEVAKRANTDPQAVMFLCDGATPRYRAVLRRVPGQQRRVQPQQCAAGHWMFHVLPTLETGERAGVLCETCQSLPDGTLLPPGYFQLYNGPDAWHDLTAAAGTTLVELSMDPSAPGPAPRMLLSIGEAADQLGVSTSALRTWSNAGKIACQDRPRRYDPQVLASAAVKELATTYQRTVAGKADRYSSGLSLRQAAEQLEVEHHYLHAYVKAGRLTSRTVGARNGMTPLYDQASVNAVPREWRERHRRGLLSRTAAADAAGATINALDRAVQAGALRCYLTDGRTRKFAPADIMAWRCQAGT